MWNLLKVNNRDCVFLLTTSHMSNTSVKYFSGVLWTFLYLLWCFCFLRFIFWFAYYHFYTDFTPWSTFSVISLRHVLSRLLEWVKSTKQVKDCLSQNFERCWQKAEAATGLKGTGKEQKQPPDVFYEKTCS